MLSPLFADEETAEQFSTPTTLARYGAFEAALARAQSEEGLIPETAAAAIETAVACYVPEMAGLHAGLLRDGVAIPDYVRQLRAAVGEPHAMHVHLGTTSQDVIDTAMVLAIRTANDLYASRLERLVDSLDDLFVRNDAVRLMGRTRMQEALPIRAADRVARWRAPVDAARQRLGVLRPEIEAIQLGGPVGDRRGMQGRGDAVAARLAVLLGLSNAPCWHTDRSRVVHYGSWLATVAGACGKLGMDVALMAQMGEIEITGGGKSSAMPHKMNPVRAEALVALAGKAAALAGGLQNTMLHEQERSGSAWSLESLLLPQLCEVAGASLLVAGDLVGSVERMGCR